MKQPLGGCPFVRTSGSQSGTTANFGPRGVFEQLSLYLCGSDAGFSAKMVEEGINKMFDCTKDREHDLLIELLTALLRRNAYNKEEFLTGLRVSTDRLSDLM